MFKMMNGLSYGLKKLIFGGIVALIFYVIIFQFVNDVRQSFAVPGEPGLGVSMATVDGVRLCNTSARAEHLKQVCQKNDYHKEHFDMVHSRIKRNVFVDDEYKIMFCAIPKCGSSTFKHYLGQLHDPDFNEAWAVNMKIFYNVTKIRTLDKLSDEERERVFKDYYKFVVVRHPLDRLYSAWHNKLSMPNASHIMTGLIRELVTKFLRETDQNREEFDYTRENIGFQQFLDLVERHYNDGFKNSHWASFFEHCWPCHIQYDHVFRLETLQYDVSSLYAHVKSMTKTDRAPSIIHANNKGGNTDRLTKLKELFKDVDLNIIHKLLNIYRRDFNMFGYEWDVNNTTSTCSYKSPQCC